LPLGHFNWFLLKSQFLQFKIQGKASMGFFLSSCIFIYPELELSGEKKIIGLSLMVKKLWGKV
jgi:hypothetical protein